MLRPRPSLALVLLLATTTAACGTSRRYAPRENCNGVGPTAEPAAVYSIAEAGDLRLWSDGLDTREVADRTVTVVRIGMELEAFGAAELEIVAESVTLIDPEWDTEVAPTWAVPAGASNTGTARATASACARMQFEFELPDGARGTDLQGFSVRWRVRQGEDECEQLTPFLRYVTQPPQGTWPPMVLGFQYTF